MLEKEEKREREENRKKMDEEKDTFYKVLLPFNWNAWFLNGIDAYLTFKDAHVYGNVKPQFEGILVQMGTITTHLDIIVNSISNIEDRLNDSIRAGEKATQVELSDEKRKKMVRRLKDQAELLNEACDNYLAIVNAKSSSNVLAVE